MNSNVNKQKNKKKLKIKKTSLAKKPSKHWMAMDIQIDMQVLM